jgi:hypothetical protein
MPVRSLILPIERPHAGFCERLRFQFLESALRHGWNSERDGQAAGGISETQAKQSVAYARKNGWLPTHRSAISYLTKTAHVGILDFPVILEQGASAQSADRAVADII